MKPVLCLWALSVLLIKYNAKDEKLFCVLSNPIQEIIAVQVLRGQVAMRQAQWDCLPRETRRLSKAGLASRLYRQRLKQNPLLYQEYLEKQRGYLRRYYDKRKMMNEADSQASASAPHSCDSASSQE